MNKRGRRHNEEEDTLSDLPDCILLHIMSFCTTKRAVQTSILSKRWKNLWKSLPIITLHSSNFNTISQILSLRRTHNSTASLHTLNFKPWGLIRPQLLKRIILYALLPTNVKQLEISVFCDVRHLPPCLLFSSQLLILTHLNLSFSRPRRGRPQPDSMTLFPNSLNLPALTNLSLRFFAFCVRDDDGRAEPFSSFNKLNSLIIDHCQVVDKQNLYISSTTLVNLKIISAFNPPETSCKFELSTPSLCNFDFRGSPLQKLCGSKTNLSAVNHVGIDMQLNSADAPSVLLNWLVDLANIQSLTVSHSTLLVLFSIPDLLKIEFHSLCNLKSLKVKSYVPLRSIPEFPTSVDFLLQNSPSAVVNRIRYN